MRSRIHQICIILICMVSLILPITTLGLAEDDLATRANIAGPPKVIYQFPEPNSTEVHIENLVIEVGFNEDMDHDVTKGALSISLAEGGVVNGEKKWAGHNLKFYPNNYLKSETNYTVTVTIAAKDSSGENLALEYKWNFTTMARESGVGNSDDKSVKEDWWLFWEPILTSGTIVGTLLVALIGFLLYRRKRTELRRYIGRLDEVYEKYRRDPYVCEHKLSQLKESCKIKFKRGKMEENHYLIMDKKIDDYLGDIRYRKTLTKPKIVAGVEKEIIDELDKKIKGKSKPHGSKDIEEEYDDETIESDDEGRPKKPSKPRIIKDS